jgi:hypothetical protein
MGSTRVRVALFSASVWIAAVLCGAASAGPTERHWKVVPGSAGHGETYLYAVASLSPTDAWAVGHGAVDEETGGTGEREKGTLTEHWDGTAWRFVPSANVGKTYNYLHGVGAIATADVWAVGYRDGPNGTNNSRTLTIHWNGRRWNAVRSPNPGNDGSPYAEHKLYGVGGVSARDVWAVGYRYNGGFYSELILRWNGRAWKVAYSPPGGYRQLFALAVLSPTNVWAVGVSFTFEDGYQGLIEHWDGTRWSQVPAPTLAARYFLRAITAVAADDIWATGHTYDGHDNDAVSLHWDGSAWSEVAVPSSGTFYNALYGVAALGPNDVWAVGSDAPSDTLKYQSRIDHWDGSRWNAVAPPGLPPGWESALNGVAPDRAGGLWAVGYQYGPLGVPLTPLIMRLVND